jgi:mediator of RNA polymerase II transcription subunit 13
MTPSSSHNSVSSPASATDSSFRYAQGFTAKAVTSNSIVGMSKENGAVSSSMKNEMASTEHAFSDRVVKERFISSVLATLSYHMCCESGFIPLNARTLVLPSPNFRQSIDDETQTSKDMLLHSSGLIVTLDVHLTSNGTLIIKAWPSLPVDFACLDTPGRNPSRSSHIDEGTTLFLAPSGIVGRYIGPAIDEISGGTVESASASSFSHSMIRWKNRCVRWLTKKGVEVNLLESSSWALVQISSQPNLVGSSETADESLWTLQEKPITIAWPVILCFQRVSSDPYSIATGGLSRGYDFHLLKDGLPTVPIERRRLIRGRKSEKQLLQLSRLKLKAI